MLLSDSYKIAKLFESFKDKPVPVKTAYWLSKLNTSAKREAEYYAKELSKILNQYCKKTEDGKFEQDKNGSFVIIEDKVAECNTALAELEKIEIDNPNISFTIDELSSLDLSVSDMDVLMPFIK